MAVAGGPCISEDLWEILIVSGCLVKNALGRDSRVGREQSPWPDGKQSSINLGATPGAAARALFYHLDGRASPRMLSSPTPSLDIRSAPRPAIRSVPIPTRPSPPREAARAAPG